MPEMASNTIELHSIVSIASATGKTVNAGGFTEEAFPFKKQTSVRRQLEVTQDAITAGTRFYLYLLAPHASRRGCNVMCMPA